MCVAQVLRRLGLRTPDARRGCADGGRTPDSSGSGTRPRSADSSGSGRRSADSSGSGTRPVARDGVALTRPYLSHTEYITTSVAPPAAAPDSPTAPGSPMTPGSPTGSKEPEGSFKAARTARPHVLDDDGDVIPSAELYRRTSHQRPHTQCTRSPRRAPSLGALLISCVLPVCGSGRPTYPDLA